MKFKKSHFLALNLLCLVTVFVFVEYICTSYWCYDLESKLTEPFFYALAGLLVSSVFLIFFSEQVFRTWLKRVASWFLPLTFIAVASVEEGQGLFPMTSDGRSDTAILMMVILFFITIVYAFVMKKKIPV